MRRAADISHYQGIVDWNILGRQVDVVYFNVSDGLAEDPLYKVNRRACPSYIEQRFYHFYFEWVDPYAQIMYFIKAADAPKGSYMAVDVEKYSKPTVRTGVRVLSICDILKDEYYQAMVYSNPSVIKSYLQVDRLAEYKLWLAHWGTAPVVPFPWFPGEYDTWQFAVVPGKPYGVGLVNGKYPKIDLDVVAI